LGCERITIFDSTDNIDRCEDTLVGSGYRAYITCIQLGVFVLVVYTLGPEKTGWSSQISNAITSQKEALFITSFLYIIFYLLFKTFFNDFKEIIYLPS